MPKLQHTDPRVKCFSFNGVQFDVDDKGLINIPAGVMVAAAAKEHGFMHPSQVQDAKKSVTDAAVAQRAELEKEIRAKLLTDPDFIAQAAALAKK